MVNRIEIEKLYKDVSRKKLTYHFLQPSLSIQPFVLFYIFGEADTTLLKKFLFRPVPSGFVSIIIQYGENLTVYDSNLKNPCQYNAFVVGLYPLTEPTYVKLHNNLKSVLIIFKPGGFSRLFNYNTSDIKSQVVDLELLIGQELQFILEQLYKASFTYQRFVIIEDFLLKQLKKNKVKLLYSKKVIEEIFNKSGNIRISGLCEQLGTSKKNLERNFLKEVGVGPKEFTKIIRFNNLYNFLKHSDCKEISDIIYRLGYYDQPHFINEFKSVTGYTPTEFVQNRPAITGITDRLFILCDPSNIYNNFNPV